MPRLLQNHNPPGWAVRSLSNLVKSNFRQFGGSDRLPRPAACRANHEATKIGGGEDVAGAQERLYALVPTK
jgi:hypothetical protein